MIQGFRTVRKDAAKFETVLAKIGEANARHQGAIEATFPIRMPSSSSLRRRFPLLCHWPSQQGWPQECSQEVAVKRELVSNIPVGTGFDHILYFAKRPLREVLLLLPVILINYFIDYTLGIALSVL